MQRDYTVVADVLPLPAEIPPLSFDPEAMQPWAAAEKMENFAVIHAGTRWERKSWPEDRWIEAGRALLERVSHVVLSSGPDPAERAMNARIQSMLGERALSTDGETSWAQLAWLLAKAKMFVGVDTAAMHLAAACQCPTVALFGGSKIFEWYPWRVRSVSVRPHDWLGEEAAAQLADAALMLEIDTARVVAACDEILAGGGNVQPANSRLPIAT